MSSISINLDGRPVEIQRVQVPLKQLILDVENPRIQYYLDTRLNDNITQDKIKFALAEGNDQYEKLREHIERNGGVIPTSISRLTQREPHTLQARLQHA